MNTLEKIQHYFPKRRKNSAMTGYIPIAVFDAHEKDIRKVCKAERAIVIYRGPRISNNCKGAPSNTMRCDATHAVLYRGN